MKVALGAPVAALLIAGCSGDDDDGGDTDAETSQPTSTPPAGDPCEGWTVEPVAEGLGALENVLVEDDGSLLLSVADAGNVVRLDPAGETTTVADDLPNTGGLARQGDWVYVTTGLTIEAANQGLDNGTIVRFEPTSDRQETWATGLVAPNGLALLEDGSAIATRTLSGAGVPAEVTLVPGDDPEHPDFLWSDLTGTNGAAVDHAGEWLYVSRIAERAEIWRIRIDDPVDRELVTDLGEGVAEIPDDLTVTEDGIVYASAWASGNVYRIDVSSGQTCTIASDMPQVSAVELDASDGGLVATSAAGTVYRLTPAGR